MKSWIRRLLAGLTLAAAASLAFAAPVLESIPGAPGLDTGESSLFRDATGTLHLTWNGPGNAPEERALWHATLAATATAWSAPRVIVSTPLLMENWADFATLTVGTDGTLWAQWFQSRGADLRGYDGWFARSTDGGETWSESQRLGHEFVALAPLSAGRVMAVWLESARPPRSPGAPPPAKDPHAPYASSMKLLGRLLAPDGSTVCDWTIDPDVCTCCQNTLAVLPGDRLLVGYRGHTADDVRDNCIALFDGANWSAGQPIHPDGWVIGGCPVNGPAADASGETVAIAWFTAAHGIPRVQAKLSRDGGATFGAALPIDLGRPIGRLDLVSLPDGSAVISWLEAATAENEAGLYVRRIYPDGTASAALNLGATSAARASGFARMAVRDPARALIAISYTDVDPTIVDADGTPTTRIRTAQFSAAQLSPAREDTLQSVNRPASPSPVSDHASHAHH